MQTRTLVVSILFLIYSLGSSSCIIKVGEEKNRVFSQEETGSPEQTNTPSDAIDVQQLIPNEIAVQNIVLPGLVSDTNMEFSGMAWFHDTLVLLPQYPNRNDHDGVGKLFGIEKQNIISYISKPAIDHIEVREIAFSDGGLHSSLKGFEGFEAIMFDDEKVFATIETRSGSPMMGYLIEGRVIGDLEQIVLDPNTITALPPQANFSNASDEAMTEFNGIIYTFFEDNGKTQNSNPIAHMYFSINQPLATATFPTVEYRITDATEVNADGTFWVINYFYPGDTHLKAVLDPLASMYGLGPTHQKFEGVERLVELRIESDTISLTNRPPIQIELMSNGDSRNWEGIACLDGFGFLLITDKFPETILGYVPFPVTCNLD